MLRTLTALGLVSALMAAQGIAVELLPSSGFGAPISVEAFDTTGAGIILVNPCIYDDILAGSPSGPSVSPPTCASALTPITPCGSHVGTTMWDPTGNPPGNYYFRVPYWDATMTVLSTEYFCVSVLFSAQQATLTGIGTPTLDAVYTMSISSPTQLGAAYVMAVSLTTNVGIPLGTVGHFSLDQDAIFGLAVPVPNTVFLTNFQGNLDAAGNSPGISIWLPPAPGFCIPLHFQAVVLGGVIRMTNPLNHFIQ